MAKTFRYKHLLSSTANSVPASDKLLKGEIAINDLDEKLFIKNNGGEIVTFIPESQINAKINALDKAASAEDGKVVTTVSETDGIVSETKANVKDLQLGGYSKDTTATGAIGSTDTINTALSKLENTVAANEISNSDHSITVTTASTGTDIAVNIKTGEKVIKLGNDGIYTDIKISALTATEIGELPGSTNIKEAYKLLDSDGNKLGDVIKIYKDSSLYRTYLGHVDDSLTSATDPTVVAGTGDTALCFIYQKSDGTYELVAVNVSQFLEETEFADGLTVDNHVVKVLVDPTSESYLTVSSDGIKLEGINDELNTLDTKIDDETERAISAETAIQTNVDALEQMVYEVSDNLNAEINRATNAEQSIQDNVVILTQTIEDVSESVTNEVTRATEAEQLIQTNVDALEQMVYEVSDNLNAEIDRATSAETTIQTNLNSEVERATSAETVLRESIDSIEIVKIDNPSELSTNEREAYLLKVDNATKGARISIYKDSSLYRTYLGHVDDSLVSEDSPAVNYGGGDEALCFIYYTMEGKYQLVTINVETFLSENEFLDGLTVFQGHSIKVKIDPTSEKYNGFDLLTVSTEGVKLNGVQNIVSAMVQTVDVKVEIGANSYDYLESTQVTPPNKYFKIDAKTIDIEDADSNNTGLLDAYNVKNYIDNLIIDCGTY